MAEWITVNYKFNAKQMTRQDKFKANEITSKCKGFAKAMESQDDYFQCRNAKAWMHFRHKLISW